MEIDWPSFLCMIKSFGDPVIPGVETNSVRTCADPFYFAFASSGHCVLRSCDAGSYTVALLFTPENRVSQDNWTLAYAGEYVTFLHLGLHFFITFAPAWTVCVSIRCQICLGIQGQRAALTSVIKGENSRRHTEYKSRKQVNPSKTVLQNFLCYDFFLLHMY